MKTQQNLLLPTHYFLATFTLPCELRPIARSNQKVVYNLLFKSSAAALQKLAKDPRFVGGDIGMMGGLHTWQRDMGYHPHVHFIVPGGGLSPDRSKWLPSNPDFLSPLKRYHRSFVPSSVMRSKNQSFPLCSTRGLAKRLGGPLQTGRQRRQRVKIPGALYLQIRYHQQPHRKTRKQSGHLPV
jgi:hypothetical protein